MVEKTWIILVSFSLFGEFDDFEDWVAAKQKDGMESKKGEEMTHKEMTLEKLNYLDYFLQLFHFFFGKTCLFHHLDKNKLDKLKISFWNDALFNLS